MPKTLLAIIILGLGTVAYADTCPTVNEIKTERLLQWAVYDSEDGKPLSHDQAVNYKKDVHEFVLAEWVNAPKNTNKTGSIHCYYRNIEGGNLEAYLAKNNFIPVVKNNAWYQVTGAMQCVGAREKCEFHPHGKRQQFARR